MELMVQQLYEHLYEHYDLKGYEHSFKLIGNAGQATLEWDALGRRTNFTTPVWSEHIPPEGFDGAEISYN